MPRTRLAVLNNSPLLQTVLAVLDDASLAKIDITQEAKQRGFNIPDGNRVVKSAALIEVCNNGGHTEAAQAVADLKSTHVAFDAKGLHAAAPAS